MDFPKFYKTKSILFFFIFIFIIAILAIFIKFIIFIFIIFPVMIFQFSMPIYHKLMCSFLFGLLKGPNILNLKGNIWDNQNYSNPFFLNYQKFAILLISIIYINFNKIFLIRNFSIINYVLHSLKADFDEKYCQLNEVL